MWRWAWRTPQAAAWITEPWRHRAVAQWVRLSVQAEERDAPAAIHANYLGDADGFDLKMMIEGARLSREILAQESWWDPNVIYPDAIAAAKAVIRYKMNLFGGLGKAGLYR